MGDIKEMFKRAQEERDIDTVRRYQRALEFGVCHSEAEREGIDMSVWLCADIVYAGFSLDGLSVEVGEVLRPENCSGEIIV